MAHEHNVYDSDPHFTIDPDTRVLSHDSPEKLTMMQGDHNSEVYTFEIPKTVDGHDMTLCNRVEIHYINIDGNKPSSRSTGIYTVTDLQAKKNDPTRLVCSWTISSKATKYAGPLNFVIRFLCVTEKETEGEDGPVITRTIDYAWNTAIFKDVSIVSSIDNTEALEEEYAEVLDEWYTNILTMYEEIKERIPENVESLRFYRHNVNLDGPIKSPVWMNTSVFYTDFGSARLTISVITKSPTPFANIVDLCKAFLGERDGSGTLLFGILGQGVVREKITAGNTSTYVTHMITRVTAGYNSIDGYHLTIAYGKIIVDDYVDYVISEQGPRYMFGLDSITDTVVELT